MKIYHGKGSQDIEDDIIRTIGVDGQKIIIL